MSCTETTERIELYVLGEMDARESGRTADHLAICPSCRQAAAGARKMLGQLDAALRSGAAPEGLPERVLAAIAGDRQRRARFRWASLAAAACLAAACAAWAVWSALQPRPTAPPGRIELVACSVQAVEKAEFAVIAPRRVRLDSGKILVSAEKADEELVVQTPAGDATAVGTQFYVKCESLQGSAGGGLIFRTTVVVVKGIVRLANSMGAVVGSAGQTLEAGTHSAPKRAAAKAATGAGPPGSLPVVVGIVVKVDGARLVLNVKGKDGKEKETTITTGEKTKVTLDDKDVKLSDLKAGMAAVVTYSLPDPPAAGASLKVAKVEAKSGG